MMFTEKGLRYAIARINTKNLKNIDRLKEICE